MSPDQPIAVVIIGRNEGARLVQCLASVTHQAPRVIYVDSGSTDGSQQAARDAGAQVIALDTSIPFTAARARNAGIDHLASSDAPPLFVQFIDGDCELQANWIATAHGFLEAHPKTAVVCGRRRERFPEASIYNTLIDREWDTPIGQTKACGGDALMRFSALQEAGGYRGDLIAGEEPELCVRLRAAGWDIWRIDVEMTLHDAALMKFSQWWKRNRRAGYAYVEGAYLHGKPPEKHGVRETRSALFWGFVLPVVSLVGLFFSPIFLLGLIIWHLQIFRLWRRGEGLIRATFLVLGKLPEATGILDFWWHRFSGQRKTLIEYK